jgi:hypothetical protein
MRLLSLTLLAAAVMTDVASGLPKPGRGQDKRYWVESGGTNYTVFEHRDTGTKLEFVTNSGICETTPGVNQYSGYLSVGQ